MSEDDAEPFFCFALMGYGGPYVPRTPVLFPSNGLTPEEMAEATTRKGRGPRSATQVTRTCAECAVEFRTTRSNLKRTCSVECGRKFSIRVRAMNRALRGEEQD